MADEDFGYEDSVEWLSIEEPQPSETSSSPYLLLLIICGAVLVGGATLVVVATKVVQMNQPSSAAVSRHGLNGSSILWAESSRIFGAFETHQDLIAEISSTERHQRLAIVDMLKSIQKYAEEGNTEEFGKLIDYERFVNRMDLTGRLLHYSDLEKRMLRSELKGNLEVQPFWTRLEIVDILTPHDDPASRVVYAYGWNADSDDLTEVRFLLTAEGDDWKVYDWVRCDLGLYESEQWSIYAAYANSPQMEGFQRWAELVEESDGLAVDGDFEAAKTKLRLAETQSVPLEFDDYRLVLTGYRWQALGEAQEAARCYKKVNRPQKTPGAYFGLMNCSRGIDNHEAIEYAESYEETVGPTSQLCSIKAAMYESINRKDLAIEEWKKVLRFQPDSENALSALLISLPTEGKSAVEPYLERMENPSQTIASIAPMVGWQDYEGIRFLGAQMQRRDPDSPATNYVMGLIDDLDGEYQRAADRYRLAFQAESDSTLEEKYASAYFESMSQIGEAFTAWMELPNQKSTFETLAYYYDMEESGLSPREFREIANHYHKSFPDDPLGFKYLAEIAIEEQRYEDAEKILRSGIDRVQAADGQDSDHTQSLNSSLATALYHLDRLEEAYHLPGDHKENFGDLCRLATSKQEWDDVHNLLDWHQKVEPEDPMLNYYAGELAIQEKNWDKAIQELKLGATRSEAYANWMFKSRLEDAYIEADRWLEYYSSSDDQRAVFNSLAGRFISDKDWGALQRIVEVHQERWSDDGQILKHQANAAWQRQRYPDYVLFAETLLETGGDDVVPSYTRRIYVDRLLSAMLRMQAFDRARELSEALQTKDGDTVALAMVEAAEGNLDEAQRLAMLASAANDSASRLYWHDVVGPLFLGPRFQQLRSEYPVELPYGVAPTWIAFHSEEPWQLQPSVIADALASAGAEASTEVRPLSSAREGVTAYVVSVDGVNVWIAAGTGPLRPGWHLADDSKPLAATVATCQHWLVVGTAAWAQPQREKVSDGVRSFALALAKDQPQAFTAKDDELWEVFRVYPATKESLSTWKADGHMQSLATEGMLWQASNRHESLEDQREYKLDLRNAVRNFQSSPDSRLEVVTYLLPDLEIGAVRLSVDSVKRNYTDPSLVGTLSSTCDLVPELDEGLNVAVESSSVRAWRFNSDPPVLFPQ